VRSSNVPSRSGKKRGMGKELGARTFQFVRSRSEQLRSVCLLASMLAARAHELEVRATACGAAPELPPVAAAAPSRGSRPDWGARH
nr:hypothetical protein [Tanacetum cinerariifolium]